MIPGITAGSFPAAGGGEIIYHTPGTDAYCRTNTPDTTDSFILPAGYVAGDLLVAMISTSSSTAISNLSGWTLLKQQGISGDGQMSVYTLEYVSGTPDTTFTFGGFGHRSVVYRLEGATLDNIQWAYSSNKTPPVLASDVNDGGMVFTMGTGLYRNAITGGPGTFVYSNTCTNTTYYISGASIFNYNMAYDDQTAYTGTGSGDMGVLKIGIDAA